MRTARESVWYDAGFLVYVRVLVPVATWYPVPSPFHNRRSGWRAAGSPFGDIPAHATSIGLRMSNGS